MGAQLAREGEKKIKGSTKDWEERNRELLQMQGDTEKDIAQRKESKRGGEGTQENGRLEPQTAIKTQESELPME
jgi:hypothetical protein